MNMTKENLNEKFVVKKFKSIYIDIEAGKLKYFSSGIEI